MYTRFQKSGTYRPGGNLEYRAFRVRGHITSFRDLEVYKQTTQLLSQLFLLDLPTNLPQRRLLLEELAALRSLSQQIPALIAQSFGDKFTDRSACYRKLEDAMRAISAVIARLDFLAAAVENDEIKQTFLAAITKYQYQRRKILNLKHAWEKMEQLRANP